MCPGHRETKLRSPDSSTELAPQQVEAGNLMVLLGVNPENFELDVVVRLLSFLAFTLFVVCVYTYVGITSRVEVKGQL